MLGNYNSQIQILKKYDNQLWNFDNSQLLIRPYFRSLRKRIQIKSGASNITGYNREQLQFEEEIYQADKNLIKITLSCQSEQYADEIFTYLMSNKSNLQIDSVMMQSRNYLDEFQKQINLKKCSMISNKKSHKFDEDKQRHNREHQNTDFSKGKGQQNYGQQEMQYNEDQKNLRGKGRFNRNNGNRQNNQYFQKGEQQQQYQFVQKKCQLENTQVIGQTEPNKLQ